MTKSTFIRLGAEEPAPFRLRISFALLALVAAVGLMGLAIAEPRWDDEDQAVRLLSAERGYKAAVDALAEREVFRVRTLARPRPQQPRRIVEFTRAALGEEAEQFGDCRRWFQKLDQLPFLRREPGADCAKRLRAYRSKSYLGEDMPRIQQWATSERGISGLNADARVLVSSGGRQRLWQGDIEYRDEGTPKDGVHRPGEATLVLSDVGSNGVFFRFLDGVKPPAPILAADAFDPLAQAGEGGALYLALAPKRPDSIFDGPKLTFRRLGRAILIGLPPQLGDLRVYIDGRLGNRDPKASRERDDIDFLLLRPEQFLAIEDTATGRRRTFQLVETPGAISEFTGNGRRLRDTSLDDVSRWLEQSAVDKDFKASIVASLHHDLQKRLARAMGPTPTYSYRGAALLMDGMTGEIAAAATFPTTVDQLSEADREDDSRLKWLRTNMNFVPLTIGSSAKVPFAAAIIDRWPKLASMTIDYHPTFSSVGGQRLLLPSGKLQTMANAPPGPGRGSRVNFRGFLADSNNEYALALMQSATRLDIDASSDGQWRTGEAWPANLWRFACVIPYSLPGPARDQGWRNEFEACSPYLWRGQDDRPAGRRPTATGWLGLRMGVVENDYTDFYLDTIGGGRSLWTTSNLGQSYARILSGRAVSPRLLMVDASYQAPDMPIKPATWTAVSGGMQQVLIDGTASRMLKPRIAGAPAGVFFYAKTGTADVELARPDETGHILVLAAARTRSGAPPRGPADICGLKILVINLQRTESNALGLAAELLDPSVNPAYLAWLSQPCPAAPIKRAAVS